MRINTFKLHEGKSRNEFLKDEFESAIAIAHRTQESIKVTGFFFVKDLKYIRKHLGIFPAKQFLHKEKDMLYFCVYKIHKNSSWN